MSQLRLDDISRGTPTRGRCKYLVNTASSGTLVPHEGLVILGRCGLLSGTAFDRRCEECTSWEGVQW